jgi:hypothetical protein
LEVSLKASRKAGFSVEKAVINANGEIVLMFAGDAARPKDTTKDTAPNPCDDIYAAHQKRTA